MLVQEGRRQKAEGRRQEAGGRREESFFDEVVFCALVDFRFGDFRVTTLGEQNLFLRWYYIFW
ncbi:MAG: hypothetical protein F6J96_11205 [Symploca sp. SIO1C2]|nr:hypothetical protein [Symploca sp. SIO1C2]